MNDIEKTIKSAFDDLRLPEDGVREGVREAVRGEQASRHKTGGRRRLKIAAVCAVAALFLVTALLGVFVVLPQLYNDDITPPSTEPDAAYTTTPPPSTPTPAAASATDAPSDSEDTDPFGNKITSIFQDDYLDTYFPLYAMLKSEDIYLYGVQGDYGMVLYQKGFGQCFDWLNPGPPWVSPQLKYDDFDGDGMNELAVILHVGGGSNILISDLHIVKETQITDDTRGYPPRYTDFAFLGDDVIVTEPLAADLAEDRQTFTFDFHGEQLAVDCHDDLGPFVDVRYDYCHVGFEFKDDRIVLSVAVGAQYENVPYPMDFGYVNATVVFDGEGFALEDYSFSAELDY